METKNTNRAVTVALSRLLADSYALYLKTQNYHWNVTGPHFSSLHALFQTQYEEIAVANDDIAERIRALGDKAPGGFAAFAALTKIEEDKTPPGWQDMLKNLARDQGTVAASAETVLKLAAETGDEPTADLMIARITQHQKNRWMLQAHLD